MTLSPKEVEFRLLKKEGQLMVVTGPLMVDLSLNIHATPSPKCMVLHKTTAISN